MKKIILVVAIALTATFASAQDGAKFGVKGGIDMISSKYEYTSYDFNPVTGLPETYTESETVSTTGFFVGGFAEFGLSDKLTLQPGLNYHTASKSGVKFDYLSIPVLFQYEIAESFNVIAGPSLYYSLVSGDQDKTRFNLGVGASYSFTENLFVEPRYDIGLTGDAKVSHFLIGVGYKF